MTSQLRDAFQILSQLEKQQQNGYDKIKDSNYIKVVVTNQENAQGVNYFKRCFVVMAAESDSFSQLIQVLGRSNREIFTGDQYGAIIAKNNTMDFKTFTDVLKMEEMEKIEQAVK